METKTVLVTGATDGIGKATALELAKRNFNVIIHGRSVEKTEAVKNEIALQLFDARLETAVADLASLDEVRALGVEIMQRFDSLDVLLHNAGVFMNERVLSPDSFEMTFAVNHLAVFALTMELLPLLRSSNTRVVTVSSIAHTRGRMDLSDLNAEKGFSPYGAYAQSKLANILFANELAEREAGKLTSNSLHPGVITTKLLQAGFNTTGASTEQGAATSVHLASAPELEAVTGRYFSDSHEVAPAPQALDRGDQKQLWELSRKLTGLN